MNSALSTKVFDAIIVGSGPGGAMAAKELSRRGKSVLILEKGNDRPLKEGLWALGSMLQSASINEEVRVTRAVTTGGTTSVYFGVAYLPLLDSFNKLGIDLTDSVKGVQDEVPLATLPDELCGAQVMRVRESALSLGYPWTKNLTMIDQSQCSSGAPRKAIWNARNSIREAVKYGAILVNGASVSRVLVENNHAIGVTYTLGKGAAEATRAFGKKIILAAGALVSPVILRESGLKGVGDRGFYCDPTCLVFGHVKGLKGTEVIPGSMGDNLNNGEIGDGEGPMLGDGCLSRTLFRGLMLAARQYGRLFSQSSTIGVGVVVLDRMGGELRKDGRLYKTFTKDTLGRLAKGKEQAEAVIRNAGGKKIFKTGISAAHVGGLVSIGEHVDANLETECRNLHVCDASVLPEHIRQPPTFTLLCLGQYLANRLAPVL